MTKDKSSHLMQIFRIRLGGKLLKLLSQLIPGSHQHSHPSHRYDLLLKRRCNSHSINRPLCCSDMVWWASECALAHVDKRVRTVKRSFSLTRCSATFKITATIRSHRLHRSMKLWWASHRGTHTHTLVWLVCVSSENNNSHLTHPPLLFLSTHGKKRWIW